MKRVKTGVRNTGKLVGQYIAVFMVGIIIGSAGGFFSAINTVTVANATADDVVCAEDLQTAITRIADEDMAILAEYMNPDAVQKTNEMLGGSANVQSFIATYCTIDTSFADVIMDYTAW